MLGKQHVICLKTQLLESTTRLTRLSRDGFEASVVTMNSIISCDAGWPRALESFAWLQQEKLPADLVTYNAVPGLK